MSIKLNISHQGKNRVWGPWNVTFLTHTYFISYKIKANHIHCCWQHPIVFNKSPKYFSPSGYSQGCR